MSNIPFIQFRALDTNGDPISGAKLHTWVTGTTTDKATYSDEARTTLNANPLIADSNGYFGRLYGIPNEPYTLELTDASDVVIWTENAVNMMEVASDTGSLSTRITQIAANPLDEGAIGDGAADEQTEVAAAFTASSFVVDLLGKNYRMDSALAITSSAYVKNGTFTLSNNTSDAERITIDGSIGTELDLTSTGSYGDVSVTLDSVSGLADSDLVILSSNETHVDLQAKGEFQTVEDITGSVVSLKTPLRADYDAADDATVQEVTPISDVTFDNVTFVDSEAATPASAKTVAAEYCRRLRFIDCKFIGIDAAGAAVDLRGCYDVEFRGCHFQTESDAACVQMSGTNENIRFIDCVFESLGEGIECRNLGSVPGGQIRNVEVRGCTFNTDKEAIKAHEDCVGWTVRDCEVNGTATGDAFEYLGVDLLVGALQLEAIH